MNNFTLGLLKKKKKKEKYYIRSSQNYLLWTKSQFGSISEFRGNTPSLTDKWTKRQTKENFVL